MRKRHNEPFLGFKLGFPNLLAIIVLLVPVLKNHNIEVSAYGEKIENMGWLDRPHKTELGSVELDLNVNPAFNPVWPLRTKRSINHIYSSGSAEVDDGSGCRKFPPRSSKSSLSEYPSNLMALLNNGSSYMADDPEVKDVILILGNTGSGKTTLAQIINGDLNQLHAVYTASRSLVIIDEQNRIGGPSTISKTLVPELVVGRIGTIFYDCPGFDDTRGPAQDIASNYFMNLIITRVDRVKLLFLAPQPSVTLGSDRIDFDLLVSHATRFLKNITNYRNSIGLVVTKVKNFNDGGDPIEEKWIMRGITQFLRTYLADLRSNSGSESSHNSEEELKRKIQFVETLLERDQSAKYSRISYSRSPTKCGPLSKSESVNETKARIIDFFSNKLHYSLVNPDDFGYTLKDKTKLVLLDYVTSLNDDVTSEVSAIMSSFMRWLSQKMSGSPDLSAKLKAIRNATAELELVTTNWHDLANQSKSNPQQLFTNLQHQLAVMGYEIRADDLDIISQHQNYFTFFDEANAAPVRRYPLEWIVPVEMAKQDLKIEEDTTKSDVRKYAESINNNIFNGTSSIMSDFEDYFIQEYLGTLNLTKKVKELQVATFQLEEAMELMDVLGDRTNPEDYLGILDKALTRLGHNIPESVQEFITSQQGYYLLDDEFNPPGLLRDVLLWMSPVRKTHTKLKGLGDTTNRSLTIYEQNLEILRLEEELSKEVKGHQLAKNMVIEKDVQISRLNGQFGEARNSIASLTTENERLKQEIRRQATEHQLTLRNTLNTLNGVQSQIKTSERQLTVALDQLAAQSNFTQSRTKEYEKAKRDLEDCRRQLANNEQYQIHMTYANQRTQNDLDACRSGKSG